VAQGSRSPSDVGWDGADIEASDINGLDVDRLVEEEGVRGEASRHRRRRCLSDPGQHAPMA
jgi:hypothetical protein